MSVDLSKGATVELVKTLSDDLRTKNDNTKATSAGAAVRAIESTLATTSNKINAIVSRPSQSGTDLNTLVDYGWYMIYSAVNAPSEFGTNIVYLEVSNFINTQGSLNGCVVQKAYYARGGKATYMRLRLNSGTWTAWLRTSDKIAGSMLQNADLNSLIEDGAYITNGFTNGPVPSETAMVINATLASGWTLQELYLYNHSGARYYRVVRSGSTSAWINASAYPTYKCVNFGDSIYGNNRGSDSISYKLFRLTGWDTFNAGCGGCRMSATATGDGLYLSMVKLTDAIISGVWSDQETAAENMGSYFSTTVAGLKAIDFSTVDRITISYGTNDWSADIQIGSSDVTDETITTFKGALRYAIHKLSEAFPNAKISVCGCFNRFQLTDGVVTADGTTWLNGNGNTVVDFCEAAQEVAKQTATEFIDQFYLSFNKYNYTTYYLDNTHLNDKGCEVAALNLFKKMV